MKMSKCRRGDRRLRIGRINGALGCTKQHVSLASCSFLAVPRPVVSPLLWILEITQALWAVAVSLDVTRDVMTHIGDQHKRSRTIPLCCRDYDVMLNSGACGQYTHRDVIHRVQ